MAKKKKQLRLSTNKVIAGVVGGFAEYLGIDKTMLRVVYAAFVLFTGFFPGVFFYLVAWLIMKAAEEENGGIIETEAEEKKY